MREERDRPDELDLREFTGVVGSKFHALLTEGRNFRGGTGQRDQSWKCHRKHQWRREARV